MKLKISLFAFFMVVTSIVIAQPTIATDSILQTSTCAGGNVLVPFTVTGGNFNFGNVFTAQLSNAFGQFTNPVNIGSLFFWSSGFILATIPSSTNFGIFYKIRVIGSSPADTGTPCPNTLIITQVAQLNQIISNPGDSACIGDSITLTALNPAQSYSWSTGDTTQSITVVSAGIYSVTTTDIFTCESTTSDTVYFVSCAGITENTLENLFKVYPTISSGFFSIVLKSSIEPARVEVFSLLGRKVYASQLNSEIKTIDLSSEGKGVYFIRLIQNQDIEESKVVIE